MKKELIKIIFVASIALNLAFISSGIYKAVKKKGKTEQPGITLKLKEQYGLTGEQHRKLNDVVTSFRMKLAENKSDVLDKRIDIIEMLGNPSYKTENLEDEILSLNEIEGQMNIEFVSTLLEIGNVLDREQWIKFLYNLSQSWFFSGFGNTR
jgi:uncharacterized membrane protein